MVSDITLNLLVLALLVLANAFFVAAEFALVRVRRTRIQEMSAEGNATAGIVKEAIEHINDYISATQVGITVASLGLGWLGEPFVADLLTPLFKLMLPASIAAVSAHGVAIGIAFFIITFMHVIGGELMPKSLALQYPEKIALYIVRPMRFMKFIFWPLVWMLTRVSFAILRALGIKPADAHSLALSEEELLLILSESKKAGVVSEDEQKMLQRVFKFYDKTVREIMTPRPDIIALNLRADTEQIKEAFEKGYSRLPVYDGTLDNIKGIVYVKDLIYTLQDPKLIKLVDLLREAVFVPETKAVPALLKDFQKGKIHMAIVVDEFGDTAGLVTLEDVIEEIVGEIQDEYDYEPLEVQRAADGVLVFDGKTALDRFKDVLPNFPLPDGSYETVAGLVFQLAGRVPKEGDVLRHEGLTFRILKREGRRLRKIAVKKETPMAAQTGDEPQHSSASARVEAIADPAPPDPAAANASLPPGADIPPAPTGEDRVAPPSKEPPSHKGRRRVAGQR